MVGEPMTGSLVIQDDVRAACTLRQQLEDTLLVNPGGARWSWW